MYMVSPLEPTSYWRKGWQMPIHSSGWPINLMLAGWRSRSSRRLAGF